MSAGKNKISKGNVIYNYMKSFKGSSDERQEGLHSADTWEYLKPKQVKRSFVLC